MQLPGKQRLYAGGVVVALLVVGSFVGNSLRPAAPLNVETVPGTPPSIGSTPEATPSIESPTPNVNLQPAPREVVVAMAGAVQRAGLYHLPFGSRVDDAIKAAGGARPDANLEAINLAAKVIDGEQIYVPYYSSTSDGSMPSGAPSADGTPYGSSRTSNVVSLNTGSEAELQTIPGVGPVTAQRIIEYRQSRGGFTTIDEVQQIEGIGSKKFEKMKPFLRL